MDRRPPPAPVWIALLCVLLGSAGCRTLEDAGEPARTTRSLPRYRAEGPALPAFSGRDPAERGWVKVDGHFWVRAEDAPAWESGRFPAGAGAVAPPGVAADQGLLLRTDHVSLRTNLPWRHGVQVAIEAEAHVRRFMTRYGEELAIRLPRDPLPVVVAATRAELHATLRDLVADPVAWGAFYDAGTGIVHMSTEPATRGALPWRADLRHEMTHQILDLARPPARRGVAFPRGWFWLWEGTAVFSEGLGDEAGEDTGRARIERFQKRHAWGDALPLRELFALPQSGFEGRHYDQLAALMRHLLADPRSTRAASVWNALRRLLDGTLQGPVGPTLGFDVDALQREWLATVGR